METKWYVIRTVNGKEKKVKEILDAEFKYSEYKERIKQIVIPYEKIQSNRNGKQYTTTRNHYPGYILIEIDPLIVGELVYLQKKIDNVIEFLGGKTPIALRNSEVEAMLGKLDELNGIEHLPTYNINDEVVINDGAFKNFNAKVISVNYDKKIVRLDVSIFGRSTPIELNIHSISKVC